MVTFDTAKNVFAGTRKYYEQGLKSSNKKYDERDTPWYKWFIGGGKIRNEKREAAGINLAVSRGTLGNVPFVVQGQYLYCGKINAANCHELSGVASYLAHKAGVLDAEIKVATLTAPADHVFCILGNPGVIQGLHGQVVNSLHSKQKDDTFVIDAWANVCCEYRSYPFLFVTKMKKWLTDGKRVAWYGPVPDYTKPIQFHPPFGAYSDEFLKSKLQIHDVT